MLLGSLPTQAQSCHGALTALLLGDEPSQESHLDGLAGTKATGSIRGSNLAAGVAKHSRWTNADLSVGVYKGEL
jgi:hypothetical protein